jgi:8-oxo-dGTP diphosphatase
MQQLTKVVAKVIIFDKDDNILIIRRSESDERRPLEWDVPGGMVEPEESYIDGAVRETKEEVGFDIDTNDLPLVYTTCDMTEYGNVVWIYYSARVNSLEPTLSHEHDKYQWVTVGEALSLITYGRQNKAIDYITSNKLLPPIA